MAKTLTSVFESQTKIKVRKQTNLEFLLIGQDRSRKEVTQNEAE